MKKIYKKLIVAAASLIGFSSIAQVNAYSFAQLVGAYTPVSGGTVVATATSLSGAGSLDDNIYNIANGSFPFSFSFNGTPYTGCNISTNGFITFGATAPGSTLYTPISGATTYSGAISAFGGDLNAPFALGTPTVSGEIRMTVVGVTPNREIVFQYSNWRPAYSTSGTNAPVLDFQIRLAETTNKISVVYGSNSFLVGSTISTGTREVGLRGSTSADYNNRNNASTVSYSASTAGAANTASQTYSTAPGIPGMPTSGMIYQWTPPNNCTGAPSAGTVPPSFSICPNTTAVITNTSSNLAAGITYQWMQAPAAAGPYTNVSTGSGFNTVSLTTTSLTVQTFYQLVITCTNSAQSVTTAIVSVNPNNPATLCYCNQSLGGSGCTGDNITNVSILGTLFNNNSTCTTTPTNGTYSQFPPSPSTTASLSAGASYSISVNTTASNIESLWIDYNQNGVFDASEHTQITTSSTANLATITVFNVPASAVLGQTGMRVRSRGTGNPNGPTDACTNFGSGETEDYIVTIVAGTPCAGAPATTSIIATSTAICSGNTVTLSLANTYTTIGIAYQWFSAPSLAGPYTAIVGANATTYASPSLTATIFYEAVLTCTNGPASTTLSPVQISILGGPSYATVPFIENFDNTWQNRCDVRNVPVAANWNSNPTTGNQAWRRQDDGASAVWSGATTGTVAPLAGAGCADFHSYFAPSASTGELNLYVNLNLSSTYTMSFYYTNVSGTDSLEVFLSTNGGATFTKKSGYTINASWNKKTILLPAVNSPSCVVKFKATSDFGNDDIAIDSLQIQSPCVIPTLTLTASQSAVCNGGSSTLTASGATTYSWNTTATTSSISVTPSVTSVYTVTGSNGPGCTSTSTISISVNPNPTVTVASGTICAGNSFTLSPSGASTYTFSTGPVVTPTATSNYSVTGTSSLGCNSSVAVATVVVNALPGVTLTAASGTVCTVATGGSTVALTGSPASGAYSGTNVSGNAFTPATAGTFTPVYSFTNSANGCANSATTTIVVSICTGINGSASKISGLLVYPNPNMGEFTVELNNGSSKSIQVMDVTGRIILSNTTVNNKVDFNINTLANGVYYVKIQSNNSVEVVKIVKQ